ncbi:MAG: glycine--tRNA ligase subunit beta [Betaproteobacteria bacterium]|nr:glycine--tRNA ligase subunit beta [Betaproteobacteria bacterium]
MKNLLVELLTEELPPKALNRLGEAFASGIDAGLRKRGFLGDGSAATAFATPRRLAVSISAVRAATEPRSVEVKLMPVAVGLGPDGQPTPALRKKLAAAGLESIDPATLKRRIEGKAETLFADAIAPSVSLAEGLQAALEEAIAGLPIPKVMSYQLADGVTTVQFVRPAHGLVALHGADVVTVRALGLTAGRLTHGHRFEGARDIALANAQEYEARLESEGRVIVDFGKRRSMILHLLREAALREVAAGAPASLGPEGEYAALLDEVTALVEMPAVYVGRFEREFLSVPQECLILTMRQNQKYFPLFDSAGKLTEKFLLVSNLRPADPSRIVQGNERVVRPRLADARFFFETDRRTPLADRVAQLATVVYHGKLGTQLERVERLRKLATRIQMNLPRGATGMPYADRAALLAKADLVTLMVGEFPELQGIMGKYYALAGDEEPSVVRAIEQHYWPRFAGDQLPDGDVSIAVALADRLDAAAGFFSIGQVPTGDKDPFGLRRAALGIIRILAERALDLDFHDLVGLAFEPFPHKAVAELEDFVYDRLRGYLREMGFTAHQVEAVVSQRPARFDQVKARLEAVAAFARLPESEALAAANKRVKNILDKSGRSDGVDTALFTQDEERRLHAALAAMTPGVEDQVARAQFEPALVALAGVRADVDAFFDKVLVNAQDPAVRANRLALLTGLERLLNRVADISRLAA